MQKTLFPLAASFVLAVAPAALQEAEPVVHSLEVALDAPAHTLVVTDRISLPADLAGGEVEFTLHPVVKITASEPSVSQLGLDEAGDMRWKVAEPPSDGVLQLTYAAVFNFSLSDQKEEYTRGFRETLGFLGKEGVYLSGDSGWVPTFGERMLRFDVSVTQPDGWHVISQGDGSSRDEDGTARWSTSDPMEQVYLVGGPVQVRRDSAGAVEASVYMREMDEALARKYLDATARYVEMYRRLIGPYPYSKFALVENFWETGYGMPSFTLLGPQVIRFPFILHSSYPHEILHNWWGNSVFVDYESGNWCEGLTAYMADHLIAEQRGTGDLYRRNALQKYRDYVREGRDFPLSEFRSRHSAATEAVGYGKALMTFHMLRRTLGEEDFTRGLVDFYRKQRGKRASFDDLRAAWEKVSERDLCETFVQWIGRTGAPQLELGELTVQEISNAFLLTGSLEQVQEVDPFKLEVPVVVLTRAGLETFDVKVSERSTPFTLALSAEPVSLEVDPHFDLFRVLDPRETPPTIGQLFGEPEILAVLPAEKTELYRGLMDGWQSAEHSIETVLESELSELPADRSVWVLGRTNRFASEPVTDSGVQLGADAVPFADHSLVVIRRHPRNLEKVVGWLVLEPEAAAAGMIRKLPHYGKYSFLAFQGDEPTNVVKGEWPTTGSPLAKHFGLYDGPARETYEEPRAALAELPPVFSEQKLLGHVSWLAHPEREGRGIGTKGIDAAADYIAKAFAEAGLEPAGDDGTWFQEFKLLSGPDGSAVTTRNVIGLLPGTDADWAEQSFLLSAHYDHLGYGWPDVRAGEEGKVHFGADDNASGVAVMIELVRNLAAEGGGRRNLLVIAFSAEEVGRLGSRYYVGNAKFPLDKMNGVINLDTVGRLSDGKLAIHGTGTADEWQHIFRGCGFVTGIQSTNVPGMAEGSDQFTFIEKGIPGVQIFTGTNPDYHRPSDTADKVKGSDLVQVATFVKEAVGYMLEREEPLTNKIEGAGSSSGTTRPAGAQTGRKVSFGSIPDMAYQGDGVLLSGVTPGSPAEKAGLREGDVLVEIDETVIDDLGTFAAVLRTLAAGDVVTATVERDGEEIQVKVTLVAR